MAEQRDGVQSLRVDGPDPDISLQTPESMVDRSVRVRRKLPTPPLIDHRGVEEHIRRTMDKLRTQKAFRRHLGGAQNNYSDSSISTVGLQNLCSITAPVISGRRRMAANFPVSERRTTDSAVIILPLLRNLTADFSVGFMDDFTIGGPADQVSAALNYIQNEAPVYGLRLNVSK